MRKPASSRSKILTSALKSRYILLIRPAISANLSTTLFYSSRHFISLIPVTAVQLVDYHGAGLFRADEESTVVQIQPLCCFHGLLSLSPGWIDGGMIKNKQFAFC